MPPILPRTSNCHKYKNSAKFAVNIKTLQILAHLFYKIENAANLMSATNIKPSRILRCHTFQSATNVLFYSYFFFKYVAHLLVYRRQSPYGHCWFQEAAEISEEAATTKQRAIQLNDDARQLSTDVDAVTIDLERYEQQVEIDARLVQEVGGPSLLVM